MQWLPQNEPDRAALLLGQEALRHVPLSNLPVVTKEKYHSHLGSHSSETDANDGKKVRLSSAADAVLIRDSGAEKRLVLRHNASHGQSGHDRSARSLVIYSTSKPFDKFYSNIQGHKDRSIIILINQPTSSFPEFLTLNFAQHQQVNAHEVL